MRLCNKCDKCARLRRRLQLSCAVGLGDSWLLLMIGQDFRAAINRCVVVRYTRKLLRALRAVRVRVRLDAASALRPLDFVCATRSCLSIVRFAHGLKRSMGHVMGAKKINFLIRVADRRSHHGGRAG